MASSTFEHDRRSCTLGTSGRKLPQGWPCPHAGRRRRRVAHGINVDLEIPWSSWPASRSETLGSRAPENIDSRTPPGVALENIDSKITGRVAREQALWSGPNG